MGMIRRISLGLVVSTLKVRADSLRHLIRVHIPHNADGHVGWMVEGAMTIIKQFRGDLPDGLDGAADFDADRMALEQTLQEAAEQLPPRIIFDHQRSCWMIPFSWATLSGVK